MGSNVSYSQNQININDYYTHKQLLNSRIGRPILLQVKREHRNFHNSSEDSFPVQFIQKYQFAVPQKQFNFQQEKKIYQLRKSVLSKIFLKNNESQFQNNQPSRVNQLRSKNTKVVQIFQYKIRRQPYSNCMNNDYILQIYTEHISICLANIKKIINLQSKQHILWTSLFYQQALYIYFQSLKGYQEIAQTFKLDLPLPTQFNIGFNTQGQCKVWINSNFSKNTSQNFQRALFQAQDVIKQLVQLIKQRCINPIQFQNQTLIFPRNSFANQIQYFEKFMQNKVQVGKQYIQGRFKIFEKDNCRWRYSRQKVSMKSNNIIYSPVVRKNINQNQFTLQSNSFQRRYNSQSKTKKATIFHKQNQNQTHKVCQKNINLRFRSISQNNKNSIPMPLTNLNKHGGKTNDVFKIRDLFQQNCKDNKIKILNNIFSSPGSKKYTISNPSKDIKNVYTNSNKKNYSQSVTNVYSLTNHGSPLFLQNPSQFYLNKPVTTLLSDPLVNQSSKLNKQKYEIDNMEEKEYYKVKSFKQHQMAKFIKQKLTFCQSTESAYKNNDKIQNKVKQISYQFGRKSSSKLFFQDSNLKRQKKENRQENVKLEIKQFNFKDCEQTKTKNPSSTQRQELKLDLNIQGFERVKQNDSKLKTSRENIQINSNSQKNLVNEKSQNSIYNKNDNLNVFQSESKYQLHHSVSSVKIPTSVQLQSSRTITNRSKQDFFSDEARLKKQISLQKYRKNLELAIYSNEQIQQIKILSQRQKIQLKTQKDQSNDFQYSQNHKDITLSGQELANQFKKLLQSDELVLNQDQNSEFQNQNNDKNDKFGLLLIKKQSSTKRQTLEDFIDQFNVQITQMSQEDDESFILQTQKLKNEISSNNLES